MKFTTRTGTYALFTAICLVFSILSTQAQKSPKPLRALLITGGCCHSYATQTQILKTSAT